jgi:hypothetical protein
MASKLWFVIFTAMTLSCWLSTSIAGVVTTPDTQPVTLEPIPVTVPADALTDDQISSFGCVIGTVGLFAAGYMAGPSEAIMLWGGGLLTPSNSGVLAVSILGGLGFAGCSIGATLAPTVAWVYEQTGVHSAIIGN